MRFFTKQVREPTAKASAIERSTGLHVGDGHALCYSRFLPRTCLEVASLAIGIRPPKTNPSADLAPLVKWEGAIREPIAQWRLQAGNNPPLAFLNKLVLRAGQEFLKFESQRKSLPNYPAIRRAFSDLAEFVSTRPPSAVSLWLTELTASLSEQVNLARHMEVQGASSEVLRDLYLHTALYRWMRTAAGDRERAGLKVVVAALEQGTFDTIMTAMKPLSDLYKFAHVRPSLLVRGGFFSELDSYLGAFGSRANRETLRRFADLLQIEKRWSDWCIPGCTLRPLTLERTKENERLHKLQGRSEDPEDALGSIRIRLVGRASGFSWPGVRAGHAAAISAVELAHRHLVRRVLPYLPTDKSLEVLQYDAAFGILPSEETIDQVMKLQEGRLVKESPEIKVDGLHSVFPRPEIEDRLQNHHGVLITLSDCEELQSAALFSPGCLGRNRSYLNHQADLPEFGKTLAAQLNLAEPSAWSFETPGLGDLVVDDSRYLAFYRRYGVTRYEIIDEKIFGTLASNFPDRDVRLLAICRLYPNPNTALRAHLEKGWEQEAQTYQDGNETFAILSRRFESPLSLSQRLLNAGLVA